MTFDLFARDHASGAFVKVGQAAQRAGREMDGLGRKAGGLSGHFTAVSRVGPRSFGLLATGAKAAGLALGAAAVSGAAFGLKTAASMEQARISFTTMLGSAQKADSFLRQLQKFAASTPFEFPELQTAASSLISAGINANKVIPIMRTLGDVTSGMGTGSEGVQRATIALQQMSAAGKITGEDLNQLRDAGVPVFDLLAAATGKSKAQVVALAQAGKLGSKELGQLMKALETGKGLERFSGLMEKQSQSLSGLFSTLKDNVSMTLANLVTPAIPAIKTGLNVVSNAVQSAAPHIQAAFAILTLGIKALFAAFQGEGITSNGFVGAMERIGVVLRAVAGFVQRDVVPALGWLTRNFDLVVAAGAALAAALATIKVAAFIGMIRGAIVATRAWAVAQGGLNAALFANPIGLIVAAVAVLVAAFVIAYKRSDAFREIVNRFAQTIMANAVPALHAIGAFITGTVVPAMMRLWAFLAKNLGPTFTALGQLIMTRIWPALQGLFVRLQQVWPTVRTVIVFLAKLIGVLLATVVVILGKVLPVIIRLAGPVFTLLFAAIGKIIGIVAALARAFIGATRTVISVFLAMVGAILNGAAKAFGWVPGIGGKLRTAAREFDKFRNQVNAALSGVKSRKVTVTAELAARSIDLGGGRRQLAVPMHAKGGPIFGPGTETSDSIPAMLSRGEHVLTAREVKGLGGHGAVMQIRKAAVAKFAQGGPVEFNVAPRLSGMEKFKRGLEEFNKRADAAARKMWALAGGTGRFTPGSGNYGPPNFRGNAANTQAAINYIRSRFGLGSGGWRATGSVANSDHPRGKALDTMIPNYLSANGIGLGNAVASFFMNNPKAFGTKYVIWRGRISEGGGWRPYFRGNRAVYGDTLAHYDHVHTSLFAKGGPVGHTPMARGGIINEPILGIGRSGRSYSFGENGPETVIPGTGGLTIHLHGVVGDKQAVRNYVVTAVREAAHLAGKPAPI